MQSCAGGDAHLQMDVEDGFDHLEYQVRRRLLQVGNLDGECPALELDHNSIARGRLLLLVPSASL